MNTDQFYQDLLNNSIVNSDSLIVGILNLPNLDANSVTCIDSNNDFFSDVILNNGRVLVGSNGNAPAANTLTGTTGALAPPRGAWPPGPSGGCPRVPRPRGAQGLSMEVLWDGTQRSRLT